MLNNLRSPTPPSAARSFGQLHVAGDYRLQTGRFPVTFYRGWLQAALTVIILVAFMTTFPAQALLGRLHWSTALGAVALAIALFLAASWFWKFALNYYSGASA